MKSDTGLCLKKYNKEKRRFEGFDFPYNKRKVLNNIQNAYDDKGVVIRKIEDLLKTEEFREQRTQEVAEVSGGPIHGAAHSETNSGIAMSIDKGKAMSIDENKSSTTSEGSSATSSVSEIAGEEQEVPQNQAGGNSIVAAIMRCLNSYKLYSKQTKNSR